MVLVGNGRAEQRHDTVAGVLVDRALEAVDALGENLEEAVQDAVQVRILEATPRPRPSTTSWDPRRMGWLR